MINKKHIPLIYIQNSAIEHHLIKHGFNEYRVKNYIRFNINLKQSTLNEYEALNDF